MRPSRGMVEPVLARQTALVLTTNLPGPEARAPFIEPEGRLAFYPYPRRDILIDCWRRRRWRALVIENEFLRATVLPELGGRLFSLYDKVSGEELFASPRRFRFGRIHLRGAWAPVGVELNFPKGHSIASTCPVVCRLLRHPDGSASIVSGATDLVSGMRWEVRFTLQPGMGRLIIHNRFTNPTGLPHGAMYWHNAAVWVGEGFRFQSRARLAYVLGEVGPFPLRAGRDYSWYKNRLWADDLFLVEVAEDWFGYYDHRRGFGALHLADRRRLPGKKFFSWGAAPDGLVWSRTFGLAGRHYGELQAGFPQTQQQRVRFPPGACFECDQCWYPIAGLGDVLAASERAAVGLRPSRDGRCCLTVMVTERVGVLGVLCRDRSTGRVLVEARVRPRPLEVRRFPLPAPPGSAGLYIRLDSSSGFLLEREIAPLRPPSPGEIERARRRIHPPCGRPLSDQLSRGVELANWECYSTARGRFEAILRKHPRSADALRELGWLDFRECRYRAAEGRFRSALAVRPGDGSAALGLGYALLGGGRLSAAAECFAAAANLAGSDRLLFSVALLSEARVLSRLGDRSAALCCLRRLLHREPACTEGEFLLAALLWSLGRPEEARERFHRAKERAPTHPLALALPFLWADSAYRRRAAWVELRSATAGDVQVLIEAACDLAGAGLVGQAIALLDAGRSDPAFRPTPLLGYLAALWSASSRSCRGGGKVCGGGVDGWLDWAASLPTERVNPSRDVEAEALRFCIRCRPTDARACLYLGNFYAGRGRLREAGRWWRRALALEPDLGIAHRNLAFLLFRRRRRLELALEHYRAAIARYPDELHFYLEAARVLCLMGRMEERVRLMESVPEELRGLDLWRKWYAVALQDAGRPADALAALEGADIIPWEGEYLLRRVWVECHLALGREALAGGEFSRAWHHFSRTMHYPPNLLFGEPHHRERSFGLYHLALVAEARGEVTLARDLHTRSADEEHRVRHHALGVEATYYSALSALWLGWRRRARRMLLPLARRWGALRSLGRAPLGEWVGFDRYRQFFDMGLVLKGLGRFDEARRAFRMALRVYGPQAELVWQLRTLRRFGLSAVMRGWANRWRSTP